MSLRNKVVLVTGGARGIGRAIAIRCAKEGASIAIVSRTAEDLEQTASMLKDLDVPMVACEGDVSRPEFADYCVSEARKLPGDLFGIVCAAGIKGELGTIESIAVKDWWRVFEINVLGTMLITRSAMPILKENGAGRIVLFSGAGQDAKPRSTAYAASKGAIWRYTESLAAEVLENNIFVNAIAPGAVNTKFLTDILNAGPDKAGKAEYEAALKQKASGGASPDKAAELVEFLLSEQAIGLSGKIISAIWDPYKELTNLAAITQSDLFNVRRIVDENGGTRVR